MLNNNIEKKLFFPALTGYRAIAAWLIFIYHFFPFKNPHHSYPEWVTNIIRQLHIGVDMFFVLSGFLIAYRYYDSKPLNFKKYMVNRFARIYPMYFIVTLGCFIVVYFSQGKWNYQNTIEAILSFTLTKALFKDYFFAGVKQGWTLTLEEIFYLTAPLYFIFIRKSKWYLMVLPIGIFAFGTYVGYWFEGINFGGFLQKNISKFIIEFFAGISLALIVKKQIKVPSSRIKYSYSLFTTFGITFITIYILCINKIYFKGDVYDFIRLGLLSGFGIAPLLYGLIFEDSIAKKILSSKWMVLLGKSSYIFYLIHKGFISIFINEIWSNKLFIFVILNILSVILFNFIEEPANIWIRKKYGSK